MKTIFRNFLSVLRRFRMAAILNILGLSVAFAAFMVIMMQVEFDNGYDKGHPQAEDIFRLELGPVLGYDRVGVAPRPFIEALIKSSPHIVAGGYAWPRPVEAFLSVETEGIRTYFLEDAVEVSPGFASVFGFDMLEGDIRAMDAPDLVLLPLSLARKLFGERPALGQRIETRDKVFSVGGVYRDLPVNSTIGNVIYKPLSFTYDVELWSDWNYTAYIRVDEAANAEGLIDNFKQTFDFPPADDRGIGSFKDMGTHLRPVSDLHFASGVVYDPAPKASRSSLAVLFGIAIIIILIAGINYMNFSAAMTPMRIRSINTQKVLGAGVGSLRLALLVEAVLTALIAYAVALLAVEALKDTPISGLVDAGIGINAHIPLAIATGVVALSTGLLAGIYPAMYMTSFPPAIALKGSFGLSPRGRKIRNALIGVQFIASFALVIGASFMYLQNRFLMHADLGYGRDQVIVAGINDKILDSRQAVVDNLKTYPGIEEAAYSASLISNDIFATWGRQHKGEPINFNCLPADQGILRALGIEVVEGRDFRAGDAAMEAGTFIFNESARAAFGLDLNGDLNGDEIIGFIPDIKFASLHTTVEPMAFYVYGKQPRGPGMKYLYARVKAGSGMADALEHVRRTLAGFDADYIFDVRFLSDEANLSYAKDQKMSVLISLFSFIAILISIVGVFGLVVFESEYRRREISVRKVFGSTTSEIVLMFNKTYLRILCLCFACGAPVAYYAVSMWLDNFAYRTPLHWWVYPAAFLIVSLLTVATVTFQCRTAANANPADNIKAE
ncbi:MAG: ABC transporter permease [Tannerellaceae bacterium]|jgi:putative ABC transport system permease protein|nr:ABC transporter permease [Tannerellaceae bacterium]